MHLLPCPSGLSLLKKAVEILKSSSFVGGSIDPCLYVKKGTKGVVYIALYVDDNLMVEDTATIDNAKH